MNNKSTWDMMCALKDEFKADKRFSISDAEKSYDCNREVLTIKDSKLNTNFYIGFDIIDGLPRTTEANINSLITKIKGERNEKQTI